MIIMDADKYRLVDPFDIDNGELNGLTPQEVFALGYEYGVIREKIESREPFEMQFHSDNYDRIKSLCKRREWLNWELYLHDDWPLLVVSPSGIGEIP